MDSSPDRALAPHEAREDPLSECPVLDGNDVHLLHSGHAAITSMFDEIEAARHHLHLEYYIFDDVHLDNRSLVCLLLAARARGVQVALIYDSVGSHATPGAVFGRLEAAGAQVMEFRPINPLRRHFTWHLNDRDHRKLMVIDGKTAFMGGVNLSRIYENPQASGVTQDPRKSFWHDCAIRLRGPAVAWAQRVFLETWDAKGGEDLGGTDLADGFFPVLQAEGHQKMRIEASAPLERRPLYFTALRAAIAEARQRILLATGYFVPSRRDWQGLADAAARGVSIDLVLPGHADVAGTLHAGRALYGRLLEAGVRIHELQDGLLHAKAATIDGVWSVIGSSNFDRRSYRFNNEVDAVLLGCDMAEQVEDLLRGWMRRAERITLDHWRRRPARERIAEYAARLWERYM